MKKYNVIHGKALTGISRDALERLSRGEWPGNVRELENTLERGVIMAAGSVLQEEDLILTDQPGTPSDEAAPAAPSGDLFCLPFKEAKDKLLEEFEAEYISKVLSRHAGNVSQAARESGVKRQYLHRLMREKRLESKDFKKPETPD